MSERLVEHEMLTCLGHLGTYMDVTDPKMENQLEKNMEGGMNNGILLPAYMALHRHRPSTTFWYNNGTSAWKPPKCPRETQHVTRLPGRSKP